jgi:hypothetical protein
LSSSADLTDETVPDDLAEPATWKVLVSARAIGITKDCLRKWLSKLKAMVTSETVPVISMSLHKKIVHAAILNDERPEGVCLHSLLVSSMKTRSYSSSFLFLEREPGRGLAAVSDLIGA